jgi:hypothetical protein
MTQQAPNGVVWQLRMKVDMKKNCKKCNKEFEKRTTCSLKEWVTSKFCSHSCANSVNKNAKGSSHTAWNKGKMMLNQRGENHHNWKGGTYTKERHTEMGRIEYKLWRDACFARDGYTCQKYGTVGGNLVVHHIKNWAEYKDLRLAIDNGITLSEKAHKEFHKKYGMRNNTEAQLEEYLVADET